MSEVHTHETSQREKLVSGMAWMTAGNFLGRLLGILYIIPWYMLLGQHRDEANALFNMGYQIYANFLLISTVGLPMAVAKQVAKYNVLGKEETSFYLVREFLKLMFILGAVFAAVMYLTAPALAAMSGSKELLTPVMYSLVPPVLLFPAMSVLRGFFQGLHKMKPYALSQLAEQIFRIIWILVATFVVMKLGSKDYLQAVIQSTFAAFIGMLASVGVLVYALHRQELLVKLWVKPASHEELDLKALIWETVKEAVPVIIMGSAIQAYQFIDQITFVNLMEQWTSQSRKELFELYSYMVANPSKITMLLIAVTGSIGGVSMALITENVVKKDMRAAGRLVVSNFQMLALFVLPSVVGVILLTQPIYVFFYGPSSHIALTLFIANVLQVPLFGLYTVLEFMIQAIFENKKGILYFVYGLLVKLVVQVPAIYLFQAYGPLLATVLGMLVSIVLLYRRVKAVVAFPTQRLSRYILGTWVFTGLMTVAVGLVEIVLNRFLPVTGRLTSIVHLCLSGSVGVLVYLVLTLKTRQLDSLIGSKAETLRQKLRIS